ncbi:tripartite tricarboxylate transporter substrate binding protein [Delftia sp. SD018]|uniref:Bug family tripartite tricarboxylate transporter substrate binding protein n=1 Tax=unclassified Delftia TaxID=2613839 RepID=UPI001A978C3F|nr:MULTISPECIES: tripartite tricarboxylate transporter substrate binding protein [unclassified Delftia]MBO0986872.1 tripartite tricarboxylate transporter substrate binding protein [Delftia sp. SD083]MBO1035362.1 tripartite tricarboxylate transporter substrate binding protein [Delftia sp. SD018]
MIKTSAGRKAAMLAAAISASVAGAAPVAAIAQDGFPQPGRQMRIIVPFTAGGSSDVQARMLADRLSRLWGQPVVVENKPGAGGHLGGKYVSDQPADGYTLMVGSIGLHAAYGVYGKLAYDPAKDLRVVTVLAEMPHVVVATPSLAASNLAELTALAKKAPGTVNFGSAGVGSSVHMMGELYKLQAGAPIVHVPYRGSSAALNDLLGGQIQLMFENPPTVLSHIRGGKLKALAVTGSQRLPALPDVPTAAESGLKDYVATSWTTVAVSSKVPEAIVKKLNDDIRKVVATPEFRKGLQEQGMSAVANSLPEAQSFVAREKQRWDRVIAEGHISAQ